MLKLIHLTDLHMTPPGVEHLGCCPRRRLEGAIDSINREHADAEWVIVTGDLTALGQSSAYHELKACLDALRMPYRLCLGNGDHRGRFRSVFADAAVDDNGFVQSVIETREGRLVLLDTLHQGAHWGALCADRRRWLARQLDADGTAPHFLFMHHPPFSIGIGLLDELSLKDPGQLAAILARGNVRHLFLGHAHRPIAGSWRGVPFTVMRSIVSQFALTLDTDQPARCLEPPMYGVVLIDDGQVVVHFHDYAHDGPVTAYRPVPDVIVDDEAVATSYQDRQRRRAGP